MIKIKFYQNGLTATGHAYSDQYGHDLVCAGVSAIIMGALNWFNHQSTQIVIDKNKIAIVSHTEDISQYLSLIKQQLQAMLPQNTAYLNLEEYPSERL